jgi:hypothetical protein
VTRDQIERLRRLRDGEAMSDVNGRLYEEDRRAVAAVLDAFMAVLVSDPHVHQLCEGLCCDHRGCTMTFDRASGTWRS